MCRLIVGWIVVCLYCSASYAATNPSFIAGTAPDRRPQYAPKIVVAPVLKPSDALHGISAPYPASIKAILKDQGAWYTPFTRSGMMGRYDIRGYH
jgi:hypothetical protein